MTVGGVFCLPEFWDNLPDWYPLVTDSKLLSATKREFLAEQIINHPFIIAQISSSSAKIIDQYGIVVAIRRAFRRTIRALTTKIKSRMPDTNIELILDGKTDYGLRQKLPFLLHTIVQGDRLVWQIGAASIIAKVHRDEIMTRLSRYDKYHAYGFEQHKGYGTLAHRQAIQQFGLSDQHRASFCRGIVSKV